MTGVGEIMAAVALRDSLGAQVSAAAGAVLAGVLAWHAVSLARQGHGRDWTCLSAGGVAGAALIWLIAVVVGRNTGLDSPGFKLAVLTALAIATAIILYHSVYHYLGALRISLLVGLRCAAILVLVALLFKPAMVTRPADSDRPALVVLIDRSQSMGEADELVDGRATARLEAAAQAVLAERSRLESYFDVDYFAFDRKTEKLDKGGQLAELKATGEGTFVDVALADISPLLREGRYKGAILISDGAHNGSMPPVELARALDKPVMTVCVGGEVAAGSSGRDAWIDQVLAPELAISKNVTRIQADIRGQGLAGESATVALRQAGGEELAPRQEIKLRDGSTPVTVEFTPKQVGVLDLELEIGRPGEDGKLAPLPGETVAGNNRHTFSMRVGEPRIKVLYVEGRLRPEYRHLVGTLGSDPQVELMTLVQVSLPGSAATGGQAGASSSAGVEFRAFGSVGGKRLAGMPTTAEQMNMFDVLIIGDLDRSYLSDRQMELIRDWMQSGKGLLMIGGSHSFGPGGYGGTIIETLLPVEMGSRTIGQETMPFRMKLTRDGRSHAILSGLADVVDPPADKPASQLPEFSGCVKVSRAKAAAQVLAVHPARQTPTGGEQLPVLSVLAVGKGRSAAFTADTTWNWLLFRTVAAYDGVHQRFWGQLVRWLASSELVDRKQPPSAVMNLPRSYFTPGEPAPVTVRVWDASGMPADGCAVKVTATDSAGKSSEHVLAAVREQTGLYQVVLPPQAAGDTRLTMTAHKAGQLLGEGSRKIEVGQPGAEAISRSARPELMRELAREGLVRPAAIRLAGLGQLVEQLTIRYQRQSSPEPEHAWPEYGTRLHAAAMILFIVVLSVEWLLRRRWQLQ